MREVLTQQTSNESEMNRESLSGTPICSLAALANIYLLLSSHALRCD